MSENSDKPATLKQLQEVIGNLKNELKADFDNSLANFKQQQTDIIVKEIKSKTQFLKRNSTFWRKKREPKILFSEAYLR